MKRQTAIAAFILSLTTIASAQAAPLIYTGRNPNITPGASPLNGSAITAEAELHRPKEKKVATDTVAKESDLIRSSVISSLSTHYTGLLTGDTPGNGEVNFGDGATATYNTAGGVRTVTFRNPDGTTTTISFPI